MARLRPRTTTLVIAVSLAAAVAAAAPSSEPWPALVTPADRFFDVRHVAGDAFVALGYNGRILRTEDAGRSWREVRAPGRTSLTRARFVDEHVGWAVGHRGTILRTEDAGRSWTAQASGTEAALFDVDFPDPEHGFAVGDRSTLLRTRDGGRTWEAHEVPISLVGVRADASLAISDTIYYGIDFTDAWNGWIVGEYGNIRHTTDGGETWDAQHGSLLGGAFRDAMDLPTFFGVHVEQGRGVAVGGLGKIALLDGDGAGWRFLDGAPLGAAPIYDLVPLRRGGFVAVGAGGLVATGAAERWARATAPTGLYGWLASADLTDAGTGLAVGSNGVLLATADWGASWQRVTGR